MMESQILLVNYNIYQLDQMNTKSDSQKLSIVEIKKFPFLDLQKPKRVLVGIRPFRKGGIRLQCQEVKNKHLIYNYGHGGAGVSVAPACGKEVAQIATKLNPKQHRVSIIGSGIIGLMSALQCAKRGLKVRVYADRIPKQNQSVVSEMLASQVAPGYWFPCYYDIPDVPQAQERASISFQLYKELMSKSKHIFFSSCFEQLDYQTIEQRNPKQLLSTCEKVILKIGSQQFKGIKFNTMQINLQFFIQDLIAQCKNKGILFVQKHFQNIDTITELEDDVIISCLGFASRYMFNDQNMVPKKGHLIEYENASGFTGVYAFECQTEFYCLNNKILLGYSSEESETKQINQLTCNMMIQRASKFYSKLQSSKIPNSRL